MANSAAARYVRGFLVTGFAVLGFTGLLNYAVDPAKIYSKSPINPSVYAERLLGSKYGLWAPPDTFSERAIKKALAQHAYKFDGVVIGSSHVMSLGIKNKPDLLSQTCRSLLNLGVSGAGLEDHLTLAFLSLQKSAPRLIVFSVDPWTMAFGKDVRWSEYNQDYQAAKKEILNKKEKNHSLSQALLLEKITNLFNLGYAYRSLKSLLAGKKNTKDMISSAPLLDYTVGGENPVYLSDGSYAYSSESLAEFKNVSIPLGGTSYKTDTPCNTAEGVTAYRSLLEWVRKKGSEPLLIMTPYHPKVWQVPTSRDVLAMLSTEKAILNLAQELKIRVIGSFNPAIAGCSERDFFDHMHIKPEAFPKLNVHQTKD